MPSVRFAPAALRDLERFREFLRPKNPLAARRAAQTIKKTIRLLEDQPEIGRPIPELGPDYRELIIHFGANGYVALYRYAEGVVNVLALRHQREMGYYQ